MAAEYGAEAPFVLPDAKREPYEDRNRLMGYDPDACILCNRCVRYTQEVMQCSALSLEGRGGEARIVPTWGKSWLDTDCELCGGCLSVCPTGAIYEKFLEGAAVEERSLTKTKTTCTFCGVGCQVDLNVDPDTGRIVKVTSDPRYLPNEGNLCVKGRFAFNFVHHPDRLTEPLVRGEDGELHSTSWEHALQVTADGPEGGDRSPRRPVGRHPRLRPAHERGELPAAEARTGGPRNELDPQLRSDLTRSDSLRPGQVVGQRSKHQLHPGDRAARFLLVIGSNTTEAHPVLALRMKKAVRNGATLVVADPRKIWLTSIAKRHLQLRPGTDVWLLNAMMHTILAEGLQDEAYIARAHRGLRRGPRGRGRLHARGGRADHGRTRRRHPRDGARVRAGAARGDLLHARHHRARLRRRQHLVAREPRPDDRATSATSRRASTPCAARTTSRA